MKEQKHKTEFMEGDLLDTNLQLPCYDQLNYIPVTNDDACFRARVGIEYKA